MERLLYVPRTRAVKRKNKIDERQSAYPLMQIDETGVLKSKIRNNAINIPLNLEFLNGDPRDVFVLFFPLSLLATIPQLRHPLCIWRSADVVHIIGLL